MRDYVRVVWRRRYVVLVVALLAPAAAVALSLRQAPVYSASAQVLLSNENLAATLTGVGDTSLFSDPERLVQTQADLARVPAVARVAIRHARAQMTVDEFLDHSSVSPRTDSDLLDFTVENGDRALASRLATAYARAYTAYRQKTDTAATERALAEADQHLDELKASGGEKSPLYASLADKAETLRTMKALQTSNASVVRAAGDAEQVSPRPVRNGGLALALGLVLGIGLAFLRETLDTRVRTADQVREALDVPLLARLPQPPKRLGSEHRLITLADPGGVGAEAFRVLRTNLDFVNLDRSVRSILLTSAVRGEGKSTTAANLAVTLARAGRRVALVDLDLRRPTLHRFFDLDQRSGGLTTVALGHATLAEALRPIVLDAELPAYPSPNGNGGGRVRGQLEVLPAGPTPPDPAEFIETSSLGAVLGELREQFDTVLIDSPPVLAVGDAMTLSARVDGVLLVARMAMLRRPMLRELHRALEMSPAKRLGFVLAAAEAEERYGAPVHYRYYGAAPSEKPFSEFVP